jgi:hypothetical protein
VPNRDRTWTIRAVASWLDDHGVPGLMGRVTALVESYQDERLQLDTLDFTSLVIRALVVCITAGMGDVPDYQDECDGCARCGTCFDIKQDHITYKRVATTLGKQRFQRIHARNAKYSRIQVYPYNP